MLNRRSILATAAVLATGTAAPPSADAQIGVQRERNAPSVYAITNARIVPGSGSAIERGTVVVRNGIITAVGANAAVPADARTVDGSGLTVYPGFIEAFGSLGMPSPRSGGGGGGGGGGFGGPQAPAAAAGAANSTRPAGQQPELTALELLAPEANGFAAAQAAGFTSALTAPASGIFVGQSAVISLRNGEPQELLLRSPVAMHVGFATARGFGGGYPVSILGVFAVLRQTLLDARHYAAEQAAYAANPRGRSRPQLDASLAALQPALAGEMPVVMHADTEREIVRALDLAQEFDLRAMIAGGREAHRVADRLKAENVPVLLGLDFPTKPTNRPAGAAPEPLRVLRERVEAPRTPAMLADAGVRLAFQSGGSYDDFLGNLQKAVESGLSREQALRALTTTPAELFGVANRLGSVETGKIANLTLVRGDAFAPGARVVRVFVDGEPVEVKAPAATGRAATLAGTWTMTVTIDGTDRPVTLGVQQTGDAIRGTLQGALGTDQITGGTFDADSGSFRFTASVTLPAGTEEATFAGTLEGNTMRGTMSIVGHEPGTFVGTRPNAAAGTRGPGGRSAAARPPAGR